jgi:hypothetical protein
LATFENVPEEKRAALEKAIKESFKQMLANGKRRSLQANPLNLGALIDTSSQVLQLVSDSGALDTAPPIVKQAAEIGLQVINNPAVQNAIQDIGPLVQDLFKNLGGIFR